MPRVSVILTSYNHAKFICESIESVLAQTFSDFELLILDDASTDNSWELINQYDDPRIKAFRSGGTGEVTLRINAAISGIAQGEYIAIHHSDDIWEFDKLERQITYLDEHVSTAAVFTNALPIDENGLPLNDQSHFYSTIFNQPTRSRHEWLRHFFNHGNALCHPSVLIRKSCYQECGAYKLFLRQTDDFDMWIRLLLKHEIHVMPEKLIRFRVRSDEANVSGNRRETRIRSLYEFYRLLQNYRRLESFDDLVKIFPSARNYDRGSETDLEFALAMAVLREASHGFAKLFAQDLVFEAISDPARAANLRRLYQFNEASLFALTAQHDVFSREAVAERDGRIGELNRAMSRLGNQVEAQRTELSDYAKQAAQMDAMLAQTREELTQAYGQVEAQRAELSAYGAQAVKMSAALAQTREELAKAYAQAEAQRAELSAYAEQAAGMGATLAQNHEELHKAYGQIETQRAELSAYAEQANRISAMLAENRAELSEAYGQVEAQRAELDALKPICSVVIPTKNGGALFREALDALARQTLWNRTELIVVDSGSKDDTVAFARLAGARVFEIPSQEFNHGLTRDFAISQATTEHVILMVQDAVPADANLLENLLAALKEEGVAGAYARQIPQPNADALIKRNLNGWLTGRTEREVRSIPNENWYASLPPMEKYFFCNFDNVCSAVKKSVWQSSPFGAINFGEDIDWAERVLKSGHKIIFEPSAAVIHSHDRPPSYEYKRTYVCHRKLYAMFGLHLVQSMKGLWKSWMHATGADISYVLQNETRLIPKARLILKIPLLNFLGALGQYRAARDEIRGVSNPVRGV